ncbi:MAG: M6 family metalloprotease domain-containing protein [Gemmatimonadota bacterium]
MGASVLALLLVAGVTPEARAQGFVGTPVPGRFELPGMDFSPDGAWRRRTRLIRAERRELLRAGDVRTLNAGLTGGPVRLAPSALGAPSIPGAKRVTGTYFVPVLPIAFTDVPPPYPVEDYQELFFTPTPSGPPQNPRPYSLKTYYEKLSRGSITLQGRVFPWTRADTTSVYYENGCNGVIHCADGGRRFGSLLIEVLTKVSNGPDSATVWAQYDNDGPDGIPNSADDDGVVDFVTFLQPKVDGACRTNGIWAHRFVIAGWNNGSPFVTKTRSNSAAAAARGQQYITVNDYTIQSAVGGANACDGNFIMPIGTVAHETGHAFGLPDLYDTDASTSGTEGIGEWGLMGSGNYSAPFSPASYDAWSLLELGWGVVDTLVSTRVVTTGPVQVSDTIFYHRPSGSANIYYLLENRQALESDSVMLTRGGAGTTWRRKAPGLLVWRIDADRVAAGLRNNRVNTGQNQGVALLQADGLNQLRTPGSRNRGDTGDPFPGATGNTRLSAMTNPSPVDNAGVFAGFAIDQIAQLPDSVIRFRFVRAPRSVFATTQPGFFVKVNGQAYQRYDDVLAPGDQVTVAVDSIQLSTDGRSRGRFLSWSNGGPRAQTFAVRPTGDTLTAVLAVEHQLMATIEFGNGTIGASVAGNLGGGIFLAEGTQVTLTATVPSGQIFTGWRGDTTSFSTTLVLRMNRPFAVTAGFTPEVQLVQSDVVADILGNPVLTPAQRTFLDLTGNRNGVYDLGDFLAYLDRNGVTPSPEVMAKALSSPTFGKPAKGKPPEAQR